MEYLGYLASIIIGLSLGLIGGGGSVLTIPILVYLFAINPEHATSYSLFIVGFTALMGTIGHYKQGNLQLKPALYFAIPSLLSLLFVRKFVLPTIPKVLFTIEGVSVTKDLLIMIVFALLMIATSIAMIRKTSQTYGARQINFVRLAQIGLLVGLVTGFLGAGGGFLIIPSLLFFANLPMKQAIGTSLFIIAINSLVGFCGDLAHGVVIDGKLLTLITLIAGVGMFVGIRLSKKMEGSKLKPLFGWFVLVMGIYIITKEIISL